MSIREIVIPPGRAFFRERIDIENGTYLFDFKYNQREDAFYLEIQDATGERLSPPFKLVSNWPMLKWHRYIDGLPPGELICADTLGIDTPGLGVLGVSVPLWYLDSQEVIDLGINL